MPKPKESTDRNIRQKKTDSDEKNLILSKMDRTSLFRRFHRKRNAPDDGKQYEITKQTHRACSVRNQTNGTPRSRRRKPPWRFAGGRTLTRVAGYRYDALGRRIEYIDDTRDVTTWYDDGPNVIGRVAETLPDPSRLRWGGTVSAQQTRGVKNEAT